MSGKQLIGLIGIFLAGVYFWGKAQAGKNLKIALSSIDLNKINFGFSPSITANFTLTNPTSFSITLNSLIGSVFLNNQNISSVRENVPVLVPANSSVNYPVIVSIGLIDTILTIQQIISNHERINIKFIGVVNAEGIDVSINQQIAV